MQLRLKNFLPRSLYGRAALILVVPIVTIQLIVSITFIQRHFEGVTRQMSAGVALELRQILTTIEQDEGAAVALAGALQMQAALAATGVVLVEGHDLTDLSGPAVIRSLHEELPTLLAVDLASDRREVRLMFDTGRGPFQISLARSRVSASNPHQLLVLMVFTSVLMTAVAYLFLRNQLVPIARLARAAEAFGRGETLPYRPRGATEVRLAGAAFLDMRARIERHIEQRTLMLSGVSHDLRTPLTRLKLGLAFLGEDDEVAALRRDVEEMERMVDEFLSFARGDAMEDTVEADPALILAEVAEDAGRAGRRVELGEVAQGAAMRMRPQAVKRALSNLVANAQRHGQRVSLSLARGERSVTFAVEDDGPGIPRDSRDRAIQPFARLDAARDPNRGGGVGLGLAIAADIARSHGGVLRLGESAALGGLKAELVLARQPG